MLLLVACSAPAPGGATDGDVTQSLLMLQFQPEPPATLFFVVDTASANGGDAARAAARAAIEQAAFNYAVGRHVLTGIRNPVTLQAIVTGASSTATSSIVWREDDATKNGAATFAAAVNAEIDTIPDGEAGAAAIEVALARLGPAPQESLAIRITSTFDGPLDFHPSYGDIVPQLYRAPIAACKLRAHFDGPVVCDAARGWSTVPSDRTTCEIAELPASQAGPCLGDEKIWDKTVSGWCLLPPLVMQGGWRFIRPPRVVGDAAPPEATIEIACNLAR